MTRLVRVLVVGGLLAVVLGGQVPEASAGGATTLNVTKVIEGTPPANAPYIVDISCGFDPSLSFTPSDLGPKSTFLFINNTCTVVESTTSGASSVSYTCDFTPGGTVDSCITTPQGVTIELNGNEPDTIVDITVTNTYDPPPPPPTPEAEAEAAAAGADVVAARPAFTG